MAHIDFKPPDADSEGYLDRQIIAGEMQTRLREIQRLERQFKALKSYENPEDEPAAERLKRETLAERSNAAALSFSLDLVELLADFITTVDHEPVDPNDEGDRAKIKRALRRASRKQLEELMELYRGAGEVPKPSATG